MDLSGTSDQALQDAQNLYRAGHASDAARVYRELLRSRPDHSEALLALGRICLEAGQYDESQFLIGQAARLGPLTADALCLRGIALLQLQRSAEALACFDQALAIKPDFAEALINRAILLLYQRRYDEALAGFDAALAVDPGHAIGWYNRGNTLAAMKRFEEAASSYERALALHPNFPQAENNRLGVLFELGRAPRFPPSHIRRMFDEFSSHYDETMLNKLGYRGHLHLRQLADSVLPLRSKPWQILDLGCGTGLVAEVFKDLGRGGRLDGIDLSPAMIEAARRRGLYDELTLGDVEAVLAMPGPTYDLVLAADTMSYFGDLAGVFRGVASRLEAGGFYLFAIEAMANGDWEQTEQKRFRHSAAYVGAEAAQHGLESAAVVELSGHWASGNRRSANVGQETIVTVEHEKGVALAGYAIALRKPAG